MWTRLGIIAAISVLGAVRSALANGPGSETEAAQWRKEKTVGFHVTIVDGTRTSRKSPKA